MSADVICVIRQLVVREQHSWHQLAKALCQTCILSHIAVPMKKRGKALSRLFIQKLVHMQKAILLILIKLASITNEFWPLIYCFVFCTFCVVVAVLVYGYVSLH